MINITSGDSSDTLIRILSNIADSLSNDNIIDQVGVPLVVALFTTLLTIWLASISDKRKEKKIQYISSIKLFKDLGQSIILLQDDIYSNIDFLIFLHRHPSEQDIIENVHYWKTHNAYLKEVVIIENDLTTYENEYSNLLYDISDSLTTEEINALIQHYDTVIMLNKIKLNIIKKETKLEESKFYILDILKVHEGNEHSIISDKHLKSCYEKLYKSSGYNKIEGFEKIKFEKIIK